MFQQELDVARGLTALVKRHGASRNITKASDYSAWPLQHLFMSQDSETHFIFEQPPSLFRYLCFAILDLENLHKTDRVKADEDNKTDMKRVKFKKGLSRYGCHGNFRFTE